MAKAPRRKKKTPAKAGARSPRRTSRRDQYRSPAYRALTATLAKNVRSTRTRLGLTQEQAAEACGLAPRHVQRIEAGTENTTFTTLARLADRFGVSASDLIRAG